MRRVLASIVLLVALGIAPVFAASPFASLPPATQPLGNTTDAVPLDQGSGCPAAPCTTSQSPSLRLGQPIQTNCLAILTPFPYQQCIDTSTNPVTLRQYIGATWYPIATLSTSVGYTLVSTSPLPVANGGTGGSAASGTLLDNITGFASTGIIDRTGAGTYSFLTAPAGTIIGNTDAQTLTNKVINCANNTCTVRAASDVTGTLPVVNGGTGDTGTAWTGYTPTLSCNAGALTTSSASGRYKTIGKTGFVQFQVVITTNGTCAGILFATVPNVTGTGVYIFAGRENAISHKMLQGTTNPSSSTINILNYDNTYPGADGAVVYMSGVYETQ